MSTRGEKIAQDLLEERFGVNLMNIKESENKTPDFFIYKNGKRVAVCEVKDLEYVEPSPKTGWKRKKENYFWTRPDNTPLKVRKKIYEAQKQLKNFNLPKILIFVGFKGDHIDLLQAIRGYAIYSDSDGNKTNLYDGREDTSKRIRPIINNINLYIWINPRKQDAFFIPENQLKRNLFIKTLEV
ncbi:MAG: hypothetical protein V2A55_02950 [Candidatus Jorgensenbacteria bacterium]